MGSLLRDSNGIWIKGFSIHVGIANSIVAELWAIRFGLSLSWDLWFTKVHMESDSLPSIGLISSLLTNLLANCRYLLQRQWYVKLEHVYHEANGCANKLADKGSNQLQREVLYDICPSFLITGGRGI